MRSRSRMRLVSVLYTFPLSLTGSRPGKSSDIYFGFQCFAADITTSFLFATCFNQISFPDFQGDIVKSINMCMPTVTIAKHSLLFLWIVRYFPPSILTLLAPSLKALVVFRNVSLNDVITPRLSHKTNHLRRWTIRSRMFCETRSSWTKHHIVLCTVSFWTQRQTRGSLLPRHYTFAMRHSLCTRQDHTLSR
jgi:hypothetical protein